MSYMSDYIADYLEFEVEKLRKKFSLSITLTEKFNGQIYVEIYRNDPVRNGFESQYFDGFNESQSILGYVHQKCIEYTLNRF